VLWITLRSEDSRWAACFSAFTEFWDWMRSMIPRIGMFWLGCSIFGPNVPFEWLVLLMVWSLAADNGPYCVEVQTALRSKRDGIHHKQKEWILITVSGQHDGHSVRPAEVRKRGNCRGLIAIYFSLRSDVLI
jgi:hypothetical protein